MVGAEPEIVIAMAVSLEEQRARHHAEQAIYIEQIVPRVLLAARAPECFLNDKDYCGNKGCRSSSRWRRTTAARRTRWTTATSRTSTAMAMCVT